jgi:hypothetical protein
LQSTFRPLRRVSLGGKSQKLRAAFLRPNGCFFKREEQKGTFACFITKEDIEENGEFQNGPGDQRISSQAGFRS